MALGMLEEYPIYPTFYLLEGDYKNSRDHDQKITKTRLPGRNGFGFWGFRF